MNVIKIKIDFEKGLCQKEGISVVTGDYNSTKIKFEFNESAADGRKIFELKNSDDELVYVDEIVNNEVILVGKREEEGEEKLFSLFNKEGDYTFEVSLYGENSKLTSVYDYITARKEQVIVDDETVEQYMPLFDNLMQELSNKVAEADSKIDEIDQAIEDVNQAVEDAEEAIESTNNLNIDVNKVDKTTQVDLTKKDGTTKTVYINDGTSLQFMWQGTSLGIKTDDMEQYVFVDLQGIQGQPGPQGEPFKIKKTYTSVAEMNADFDNMNVGDYVMIASTVEVEDNAKLYVKGDSQWIFITDFSGAQGIKGETGATPIIRIGTVTSGSTPSVTISGTAEEPVFNFVLQPGDKGEKGDTGLKGDTGNGIASIIKTASAGLIDTYTITFTDGTTTTFNVTNGADGEVTQEYVDEENERLKSVFNVLPKVSDSGESVTLNNTGDTMLYKVDLKGNTSQEVIQGEVGLEEEDTSIYVDDVNESKENYITLKGNTSQSILPSGYTQVDYIESTGTQYIDTGYTPVQNDEFEIKNITSSVNNTGVIISAGSGTYQLIILSQPKDTYYKYLAAGNAARFSQIGYNNNTIVINKDGKIYVDGKLKATSSYGGDVNSSLNIFKRANGTSYFVGRIGELIITNNNVKKRHFIPCYRNSDNVVGMYDLVSNTFYTNSGAGDFTYGSVALTPDSPQEIEVVTGLNEVEVCGKNVFNITKLENASWNFPNAPTRLVMFLNKVSQGTKMSVTNRDTTTYRYAVGFAKLGYASRDNIIVNESNWQTASTYTTTASDEGYPFLQIARIDNGNISPSDVEGKFQYEYSDTPTPYEAYKGQTYEVNLGKNLFDKNSINSGYIILEDGTLEERNTAFYSNYISVMPNTKYAISGKTGWKNTALYDKNKNFISRVGDGTNYFTTSDNVYFIRTNGLLADLNSIQIEKSDTPTSYAPYFEPIELCKIGDYQDRIYKDSGKWYIEKKIGKAVFNGSEDWNYANGTFLLGSITNYKISAMNICLCSHFISQDNVLSTSELLDKHIAFRNNSAPKRLYIKDSDITSASDFTTWLASNNVTLYYILQTPTTTEITDTTLISQLNALYNATIYSTTHINTETSNLLPYINLKYNVVTASPSPDRASEVEVVKGNNTITISNEDGTKTQTYNITLGNLELRKIGDYQDYFYKDNGNWYLHKEVGKAVLNGSEVWQEQSSSTANHPRFKIYTVSYDYNMLLPSSNNDTFYGLCNNFKPLSTSNTYNSNQGISLDTTSNLAFYVNDITTLENFKTWLSTHNTIVYYVLATPTTTQITDQLLVSQLDELQKAMSYYDKTIITQTNDDKPFILDVIGIRDLQDIFNLISGE